VRGERRIIPISSGKGGVGKTMFAINYALELSKHGKTVLVDLDLNTSSVRASIDTAVTWDLYHFFTKSRRLQDCITPLGSSLDPLGQYRNFGFVAAPRHLIEDITNLRRERREKLIDAINGLDATYVVLDLKAGLDSNVIEFLPYSNSGILVFTPHLPAATLAASDVVKAVLFRKLRAIFSRNSTIYQVVRNVGHREVRELLDRAEDTYDDTVTNLDDFAVRLHQMLGDHPVVQLVTHAIHFFRVHYVLNMFNGVKDSYETAVKPFTENLVENVSANLNMVNLGWVVAHPDVNKAAQRRVPVLLGKDRPSEVNVEVGKLAAQFLGQKAKPAAAPQRAADPGRYLDAQLKVLNKMHADLKGAGYRENFAYIVSRTLHVMASKRFSDFGDHQIFKRNEFQKVLAQRGR
jgi:MinD-like ATPase involved in chromosome partitioning or flagellar assembly